MNSKEIFKELKALCWAYKRISISSSFIHSMLSFFVPLCNNAGSTVQCVVDWRFDPHYLGLNFRAAAEQQQAKDKDKHEGREREREGEREGKCSLMRHTKRGSNCQTDDYRFLCRCAVDVCFGVGVGVFRCFCRLGWAAPLGDALGWSGHVERWWW